MKIEKTGTPESTNPGATNGGSFSLDATDLAILALLQETQGLADDLVDRPKAAGLELGSDELFHFVGQ